MDKVQTYATLMLQHAAKRKAPLVAKLKASVKRDARDKFVGFTAPPAARRQWSKDIHFWDTVQRASGELLTTGKLPKQEAFSWANAYLRKTWKKFLARSK